MTDSATRPHRPERRRVSRTAVRLGATIQEKGGAAVEVRLIDLSTHGCRIEVASGLSPAESLSLGIAGIKPQQCRLVWQCAEFVGLEFTKPLSVAVLDALLEDQQQLSEAAIGDLRDIAERTFRLARQQPDADIPILAEISRNCAVEAIVEGLKLGRSRRPG